MSRLLVGGLVLLLACGPVPSAPEPSATPRIISLSPSLTRVLLALGAGAEIVGIDRYSRDLPGVSEVPALGGVFHPDLERTLNLRPTLVLAVRSVQQETFFTQLRGRGIRVEEIEVYTLEEVLRSFRSIGEYVGREAEADALIAELRADLAEIQESLQGVRRPRVALILERDPLYVVGQGAFIHELIEIAGGTNVFADLPRPYPRISLEVLADRAPDLILDTYFDPGRGPDAASDVASYWARFSWVRRVEPFPFASTHPAPNLSAAARLLRERIHPGLGGLRSR